MRLEGRGGWRAAGTFGVPATVALEAAAANALAKDLRTQIARTDLNPRTRQALLSALGSVAGRLKEGGEEANALAKDLLTHSATTDLDPGTHEALLSALGSV